MKKDAGRDTFTPEKKSIGALLASTSPPIVVPEFQRDYSWETSHIVALWKDLQYFLGKYPSEEALVGKEYFLGSAVLVDTGKASLLLDGQQRLATATIMLAAIRDVIEPYKHDAAKQVHDQYIVFKDEFDGNTKPKLTLNHYDRDYFTRTVQQFPFKDEEPARRSQRLIRGTYFKFHELVKELFESKKTQKKGFEAAKLLFTAIVSHVAVITVTSQNEMHAAEIFETLNDRGLSLSGTDLLRSYVLQKAPKPVRDEIVNLWAEVFDNCGANEEAERFIRVSWTSEHGDVKVGTISKVIRAQLQEGELDGLAYSRKIAADSKIYATLVRGEFDDDDIAEIYREANPFSLRTAFPLLLATLRQCTAEFGKVLNATEALLIRHAIVARRDRTELEGAFFAAAKIVAERSSVEEALQTLRRISPNDDEFRARFKNLRFNRSQHGIARSLLAGIERTVTGTGEKIIAGGKRVHLEHVYPQKPPDGRKWTNHTEMVALVGNMTLLDKRLNEAEKNADFDHKKTAYSASQIVITQKLKELKTWDEGEVKKRQEWYCEVALKTWPAHLI